MGKNAWEQFAENLSEFGYSRPPVAAYEAAVKGGVKEPGRTASYALPSDFMPPNARLLTADEVQRNDAFLARGLHGDRLQGIYERSLSDPNHYITKVIPEAYFESIYGPAWKAEVKPAAILSQSRPDGALAGLEFMRYVNPSTTQDSLTDPAYAIRGPGLGYQREGAPFQTSGYMIPRGPWSGTIFTPRTMHDIFGTGHHEIRHLLDRPIPTKGGSVPAGPAGQNFFDAKGLQNNYQNRAVEVKANAGMLKGGQFQASGTVVKNTADAREFLEALLDSKPRPGDADPIAQFGPRKGKPIEGHNYVQWGLRNLLLKATPEDHKKFAALLPKVFGVAAPVAAGAAAATSEDGGDR